MKNKLKDYFEPQAILLVILALTIVTGIYFIYVWHLKSSYYMEFEPAEPNFSAIFTIVFASVGSIVALSNFITNRKRFTRETNINTKELINHKISRLIDAPPTIRILSFKAVIQLTMNHTYFQQLLWQDQIKGDTDAFEHVDAVNKLQSLSSFHEFSNKRVDIYSQLEELVNKQPSLKKLLSELGDSLIYKFNLDEYIRSRIEILKQIFEEYKLGNLDHENAKLIIDDVFDDYFDKNLSFYFNTCIWIIDATIVGTHLNNEATLNNVYLLKNKKLLTEISQTFNIQIFSVLGELI